MVFPALFVAVFLSALEPEANPALAAPGRLGFSLKLPLTATEDAADWPKCPLHSGRLLLFPNSAAAASKTASDAAASLLTARARFVNLIPEASLVGFEDQEGAAVFRSARAANSTHRPGPMEDEVIASAVRGGIAADAGLQKLKMTVESQSGKVRITGVTESTLQAATLVKLALGVDGVEEVKVDLPPDLRAAESAQPIPSTR